jgi:hypothetical protein
MSIQKKTDKEMNKELEFALKIIRNGLILSGLYFTSIWATKNTISFEMCKPIIVFLLTYCLTEFAKRYGIDKELIKPHKLRNTKTLFL